MEDGAATKGDSTSADEETNRPSREKEGGPSLNSLALARKAITPDDIVSMDIKDWHRAVYEGVFLKNDTQKFWVDAKLHKNCFLVLPKACDIAGSDEESCWNWTTVEEKWFSFRRDADISVPKSKKLSWLLIQGRFKTRALSPDTTYEVAFVVKLNITGSERPSLVELNQTDFERPSPAELNETDSKRPSPAELNQTDSERPSPAELNRTDSERPSPVEINRTDFERPSPAELNRTDSERPSLAELNRTDSERPTPAELNRTDSERPTPAELNRTDSERPTPAELNRTDSERPTPVELNRTDSERPSPAELSETDSEWPSLNETDCERTSLVDLELNLPDGNKQNYVKKLGKRQEQWINLRAGKFKMGPKTVGTISFALRGNFHPPKMSLILKGVLIHPKD